MRVLGDIEGGLDVRKALRAGDGVGGLAAIAQILIRAVDRKPTGHHSLDRRSIQDRSIYQIGS